jgi:methionyl-tRNA formyltransferase
MKILFIGTVLSSLRFLAKLIEMKANIVGVVTKKSSPFNTDFADLSLLCSQHQIPIKYSNNINDKDTIDWINSQAPDIIFCLGYSELLKTEILQIAPHGVVGFHPAKLPQNRGRHPIIWALALGLEKTASTFFFMDEGADSGGIISQVDIPILYGDNARSLYDKIIIAALSQLEKFVPLMAEGVFASFPQDNSRANYWRKRSKTDGKIDFRMSSRAIYNNVRALSEPYPGAHIVYRNKEIKIWKVEELEHKETNIEPGKILTVSAEGIEVKCYNGTVRLVDHDFSPLPQPGEYLS